MMLLLSGATDINAQALQRPLVSSPAQLVDALNAVFGARVRSSSN
jgi:hypothetical protein